MENITQSEYRNLKSRRTRAHNKLKKAVEPGERVAAAEALAKECDHALGVFEDKGWPDDWALWERTKSDAELVVRFKGKV